MAIFPLRNSQVANYDCLKSNTFKSGMVLIRDLNGYAVKADRSSFTIDFLSEQRGRFLGFASGDHDVINNMILSDPVGSSFVDSNGRIVDNPNSHYGVYKRSIAGGFSTPTEFNKWFLFTATRSGTTLSLYLNGVLIGSFTTAYNHSSIFDLTIGKWDNGTYNPARVAAARLYQNVALTQDQIRRNFHAQIGTLI